MWQFKCMHWRVLLLNLLFFFFWFVLRFKSHEYSAGIWRKQQQHQSELKTCSISVVIRSVYSEPENLDATHTRTHLYSYSQIDKVPMLLSPRIQTAREVLLWRGQSKRLQIWASAVSVFIKNWARQNLDRVSKGQQIDRKNWLRLRELQSLLLRTVGCASVFFFFFSTNNQFCCHTNRASEWVCAS